MRRVDVHALAVPLGPVRRQATFGGVFIDRLLHGSVV